MSLAPGRVAVVVLGDLGRSPRMLNQSLVLAQAGAAVDLVGLAGTPLPAEISAHPIIRVHALPDAPTRPGERRTLARAGLRAFAQAARLQQALMTIARPDLILVQNPPAVPTLLAAAITARIRRTRWMIDWHNLGSAMVAERLGPGHAVTRAVAAYEHALARRADAHLCVSRALASDLHRRFGIDAVIVYDRPSPRFVPLAAQPRADFRRHLFASLRIDEPVDGLVVSSTSWTSDEDFGLLLDALQQLEAQPTSPRLAVVVSGAGAGRALFERQVEAARLERSMVRTVFLSHEDYPRLLAAADLGLCLHRSTSGLDLPMKIADMMGAGLPVCAFDYAACLDEILPERDGLRFRDARGLADVLLDRFATGAANRSRLDTLPVTLPRPRNWSDEWNDKALSLVAALLERRSEKS